MKTFKLENQPEFYQLSIHLNNMKVYWHKNHASKRIFCDQKYAFTTKNILEAMTPSIVNYSRRFSPLHFRCQQLMDYYGQEVIANYIKAVYDKAG
jgi:hypothetical protein